MTAVLLVHPFLQFFDSNGDPLADGSVYTYSAGTDTPKATYTTAAGSVAASNPVVLDSAGRCTMWGTGSYKFVVKDSLGNTIKTTDNVSSFTTTPAASTAFFQSFSGTGAQTAFTLSTAMGTDEKAIMVFVDAGAGKGYEAQNPSAYTLSGTSLEFSAAPASGTNNIYVFAPSTAVGAAATAQAAAEAAQLAAETAQGLAEDAADIAKAASGYTYTYSTTTAAADPGSGYVRFNNATLSSATAMYISETTALSQAIAADIATWDNSTSTLRGRLRVFKQSAPSTFALFDITGTNTDNGTWDTVNLSYVGGSGSLSNTDSVTIQFVTTGDKGDTGATGATGSSIPIADAGGTVDAITADYTPDIALSDKQLCAIVSAGVNTSATPSFAPDGLTARTIVKKGGVALVAGDIGAAGAVHYLEYNLANTRWELLNPAKVTEADLVLADNTTADASTTKHGLMPKAANSATTYYDSLGTQTNPALNAVLTGYTSGAGTVAATDTVLQAIQKLNGNTSAITSQLVLLATATASASSTLSFTSAITSSYNHYKLVFSDLLHGSTASIQIKFSTDNGSTWTQIMYTQKGQIVTGGTSVPTLTAVNGSSPGLITTSTTTTKWTGFADLSISASGMGCWVSFLTGDGSSAIDRTWINLNAVGVNAVQFLPSAGTFTSGKIYLYGVKNT